MFAVGDDDEREASGTSGARDLGKSRVSVRVVEKTPSGFLTSNLPTPFRRDQ